MGCIFIVELQNVLRPAGHQVLEFTVMFIYCRFEMRLFVSTTKSVHTSFKKRYN